MYLTNQINSEVPVFYMKDHVHPTDFAIKSLLKFPKPIPSICPPIDILAIVVQKLHFNLIGNAKVIVY